MNILSECPSIQLNDYKSSYSNWKTIQNFVNLAASVNSGIYFPTGHYIVGEEILLPNNVDITGDGWKYSNLDFGGFRGAYLAASHGLVTGLKTSPLPDDAFVNLNPYLDASMPKKSSMWGVNLGGKRAIVTTHNPLSYGLMDCYGSLSGLTFEIFLDMNQGVPSQQTIFCIKRNSNEFNPIALTLIDGKYYLRFETSDLKVYTYSFPSQLGVSQLTGQISLTDGKLQIFYNGVALQSYTFAPPDPNRRFNSNRAGYPFQIGTDYNINSSAITTNGTYSNFKLIGFRLSGAIKYNFADTGAALSRVDKSKISHFSQYFQIESDTIGAFLMDRAPEDVRLNHCLHVSSGPKNGADFNGVVVASAFYLSQEQASSNMSIGHNYIKGLNIANGPNNGCCLTIVQALDMNVEDCQFYGGSANLGNLPIGVNYRHNFEKCRFVMSERYCVDANWSMMRFGSCTFIGSNFATFKAIGWNCLFDGFTLTTPSKNDYIFEGDGNVKSVGNFGVDGEDGSYPSKGCFKWGTAIANIPWGSLDFDYFGGPLMATGVPIFELNHARTYEADKTVGGAYVRFGFFTTSINRKGAYSDLFKVNHPVWNDISVENSFMPVSKYATNVIDKTYVPAPQTPPSGYPHSQGPATPISPTIVNAFVKAFQT